MPISYWCSDVCSSDLPRILSSLRGARKHPEDEALQIRGSLECFAPLAMTERSEAETIWLQPPVTLMWRATAGRLRAISNSCRRGLAAITASSARSTPSRPLLRTRSEEHTSDLQSRMRLSYAVFCLNK